MASEEPEEAAEAPPAAAARENAQQPPPTPPQGSATSNERPTPPSTPPQGSAAPEAPPSEPEAVTTDAPPKPHEDWRVKVYRLNDEGQWDDRGTGRVSLAGARVRVVSEAPAQPRDVLLSSVPRGPSPVSRQGENILTWDACRGDDGLALAGDQRSLRNGETACVALSFQEARGCEAVLAKLLFAIAARPASPPHDDPGPPGADPSSLEPRPETVAEDESASHARAFLAHVLGARPGERVLDLCAAPGSKASHVASNFLRDAAPPTLLVACERHHAKVEKMAELLRSFAPSCAKPVRIDSARLGGAEGSGGELPDGELLEPRSFDRVLLDPPCSGLGLRPKLAQSASATSLAQAPRFQRGLLWSAVRMLRVGGTLVYSTCTLTHEEDEGMVAHALRAYPCLELIPA